LELLNDEQQTGTFQQETIKGLVVLFYKNFLSFSPRRVSNAWLLCYVFARRFNSEQEIARLKEINRKTPLTTLPLGLIETIAYRDLAMGKNINKFYNYGHGKKPVVLGDLILSLDLVLAEIFDIFTDICVINEVDTNIIDPLMFLSGEQKQGL